MKRKNRLLGIACFICVAGAVFCGVNLYRELKPHMEAEAGYEAVRAWAFSGNSSADVGSGEDMDDMGSKDSDSQREVPDFTALLAWNSDIKGWIYGPGTVIDYPIVQASNNDYYLNHTADKKRSIIGSIFMESENHGDFSDDVTILYGHHIRGGRMFSSLSGYKRQSYYEEHPMLYLYTPEKSYRLELFAGHVISGQVGGFPLNFSREEERESWLREVNAGSTFRSQIQPEPEERIVALCTCSYEYSDARYVVYGVLREIEEDQ